MRALSGIRAARFRHLRILHARRRQRKRPACARTGVAGALARHSVQVQPDTVQSISGIRLEALEQRTHQGFCADTVGCRYRHYGAQDARRRHRCCLRPARRRSAGSHSGAGAHAEDDRISEKIRQDFRPHCGGAALKTGLLGRSFVTLSIIVALLSGCASTSSDSSRDELPTRSDQTDTQKRAQIRLQLAVGYYQQGQFATALYELKQALQIDPNFADAYGMRALVFMGVGENALAEENFQRALRLPPNNPDMSNNYGWFLCQHGRGSRSIAYIDAALKNRSYQSPSKALNNAGVCSLKQKNTGAAEKYLTRAFQQDPSNPDTNANLAKLYYSRGDFKRAQFYVGRATAADSSSADALWTAIKVERKLGNRQAETAYVGQLRKHYSNSHEFAAFFRVANKKKTKKKKNNQQDTTRLCARSGQPCDAAPRKPAC